MSADVPSPIDLRIMADAVAWESTALQKRPWRADFFEAFANDILATFPSGPIHILELGSGPGFLAKHLLDAVSNIKRYVALDFSAPMHELARQRLGNQASSVEFVERSFLQPDWTDGLGTFDVVVTNQVVHELRHKRRALLLHRQVKTLLNPGSVYLVCDHYLGGDGMTNAELYMTVEEQVHALKQADFVSLRALMQTGGLVLHRAALS